MKTMKKLTTVIVLLLLLNSCGGSATTETNEFSADIKETVAETERLYPEYTLDRAGADFNIFFFDPIAAGGWSSEIPCDIDQPELTGESLSDSIYNRNRKIEEMYNTRITTAPQPDWDMVTPISQSVLSNSGTYDAVFPVWEFISPLIINQYLLPLQDLLDFRTPWWNPESVEAFTMRGQTYAATGDLTYMDKLSDTIVMFNKQIAADHDLGNLYQLVLDYQWTFDTMLSMGEKVSYDADGNGKYDILDHYGFSGQNDAAYQLFHSAGVTYCHTDPEGNILFSAGDEQSVDLFMKIFRFMNDDSQYFNRQTHGLKISDVVTMFQENRVLFFMRPMQTLFELRAMDADFGIIPTPLMDTDQTEYRTAIAHTTAIAASLPIDVKDSEASAMVLDTLAAESYYTVNDVLYELILGTKVVRDSESVKNLDIIFEGHIYDPGCIFGFGGFAVKMMNQWETPDTVASTIQSLLPAIETDIAALLDAVNP